MLSRVLLFGILLVAVAICRCQAQGGASQVDGGAANPAAVITFQCARFTILTDSLVRMETTSKDCASKNGVSLWDDRMTFAIINRNLSVPKFTATYPTSNSVQITTSRLQILYSPQPGVPTFTANTLLVTFSPDGNSNGIKWTPTATGTLARDPLNLNGTLERSPPFNDSGALDCYSTPEECVQAYRQLYTPGLLSLKGFTVYDDTAAFRFAPGTLAPGQIRWYETDWVDAQDWYFLGYGFDYKRALGNWIQIGGPPALPPQPAFGVWWSRYYSYSQPQLLKEVLQGYHENGLPLNIVVLDMGWHIEPNVADCSAWGGWTFNATLFPDPAGFINYLHSDENIMQNPLRLSLNLHPQTGVDHCQDNYAAVAKAMGVNPATNQTIACAFNDSRFVDALYEYEADAPPLYGVDYWWTDYGGCGGGPDKKLLWWSNYVFSERQALSGHGNSPKENRPMTVSRYGGMGNHRHPIGFSGDTFQDYGTLGFEIEMTSKSANVLFGYWSHDIGGNHNGTDCPGDDVPTNRSGSELLLRWIQFGALSPILRTHCGCYRYFWNFYYFDYMKEAFLLRNALGPYIYTKARQAYDTGVSLVHPVYYDWPEEEGAYDYADTQYMFGDALLVAPISEPARSDNTEAQQDPIVVKQVYLPGGLWMEWTQSDGAPGLVLKGPSVVKKGWGLGEIPIFVRLNSVVPLKTLDSVTATSPDPLVWALFFPVTTATTMQGTGSVYEDDGVSLQYTLPGNSATTTLLYTHTYPYTYITIAATEGGYPYMPVTRAHVLQLRGRTLADSPPLSVYCNNELIPGPVPENVVPGWYIQKQTDSPLLSPDGTLVVSVGSYAVSLNLVVTITWSS